MFLELPIPGSANPDYLKLVMAVCYLSYICIQYNLLYSFLLLVNYTAENARLECCFENLKYFTKCVLKMLLDMRWFQSLFKIFQACYQCYTYIENSLGVCRLKRLFKKNMNSFLQVKPKCYAYMRACYIQYAAIPQQLCEQLTLKAQIYFTLSCSPV